MRGRFPVRRWHGEPEPATPTMYIPRRHGCLTAWLYLIIIVGVLALGAALLASQIPHRPGYHPPSTLTVALIAGCRIANMVCAGGLFLLKRWGFYGYAAANLALVWINLAAGFEVGRSLVPLIWVASLAGVMQIGGRHKAWGRLR